jgi:hypothetical protein
MTNSFHKWVKEHFPNLKTREEMCACNLFMEEINKEKQGKPYRLIVQCKPNCQCGRKPQTVRNWSDAYSYLNRGYDIVVEEEGVSNA